MALAGLLPPFCRPPQDCCNTLWSLMVLDVLTPERMALLLARLASLPRAQFSQETYLQIYQAKVALGPEQVKANRPLSRLAHGLML